MCVFLSAKRTEKLLRKKEEETTTKGAQEGEMNEGETSSEKLRQVKYIVNGRLQEK